MSTSNLGSQMPSVVLVLDGSNSALPYWAAIRYAAHAVIAQFSQDIALSAYLLGNVQPCTIAEFDTLSQAGLQKLCPRTSLITPTIQSLLKRHRRIQTLIIIGNGELFDLHDWTSYPLIEHMVLVQVGPDSLQGTAQLVPEIAPDGLSSLPVLLSRPSLVKEWPINSQPRWSTERHEWKLDLTGYPLIWIEPLREFVHLFPVTKAQFERFLGASGTTWGDDWYNTLLNFNPRASFRDRSCLSYEQMLLTGITPDEAETFAQWLGPGFGLLSSDEWQICYTWLSHQTVTAPPPRLDNASEDARALWTLIEDEYRPQSLGDLSLMSQGVFEWVVQSRRGLQPQYAGMGKPRMKFSAVFSADISVPLQPQQPRMRDFGFRLVLRHP